MPEGVLKDLSTGRRDRKANRVIREPDSWKVGSEGELLERIRSFSDASYQRVLWLDTANHNVIFGIGYDHSFVSCSDRRDHENVHFPPLKPPPKPDDEWSDIRIEFALWGDDYEPGPECTPSERKAILKERTRLRLVYQTDPLAFWQSLAPNGR